MFCVRCGLRRWVVVDLLALMHLLVGVGSVLLLLIVLVVCGLRWCGYGYVGGV